MDATQLDLLRLYIADPPGAKEFFTTARLESLVDGRDGDTNAAAADAWRIKAANVADWYDVMLDGSQLNRDQVWQHCIRMAEYYEDRSGAGLINVKLDSEFQIDNEELEFD
jgi:hypothetical protein